MSPGLCLMMADGGWARWSECPVVPPAGSSQGSHTSKYFGSIDSSENDHSRKQPAGGSSSAGGEGEEQFIKCVLQDPIWLLMANTDDKVMMTYQLPVRWDAAPLFFFCGEGVVFKGFVSPPQRHGDGAASGPRGPEEHAEAPAALHRGPEEGAEPGAPLGPDGPPPPNHQHLGKRPTPTPSFNGAASARK